MTPLTSSRGTLGIRFPQNHKIVLEEKNNTPKKGNIATASVGVSAKSVKAPALKATISIVLTAVSKLLPTIPIIQHTSVRVIPSRYFQRDGIVSRTS